MAVLISELPIGDFERAFASYWGRRNLGIVIDDRAAERIANDRRELRGFHRTWRRALRAFPQATTGLLLAGTPALTPELLDLVRPELDPRSAPPPPLVGPFADPQHPASPGATATGVVSGAPSDFVVTDDFAAAALARLRLHWPALPAGADGAGIRIRVSGRLWLYATPPALAGSHWLVRPLAEQDGALTGIAHQNAYQLGVTAEHGADDVADRLYNELGYWWISCAQLLAPR